MQTPNIIRQLEFKALAPWWQQFVFASKLRCYQSLTPNLFNTQASAANSAMVIRQLNSKAIQKPNCRWSQGKTKNIGNVGSTYQKVNQAWLLIFSGDCFSRCNQISVNTVTIGNAATRLPSRSLRLATSEITITNNAVIAYFVSSHHIMDPLGR